MKSSRNIYFYITLFVTFLLSAYAGLADLDYYWQVDLGRAIIQDGNFNQSYNQVWGTKGVFDYYDHEWLTNIFFYVFSLFGSKAVFWTKFAISAFVGFMSCFFIYKIKGNNKNSLLELVQIWVSCAIISFIFIKVKAYSISLGFMMIELLILRDYYNYKMQEGKEHGGNIIKRHKYLIYMIILCVIWTNMHSGSMPLLFAIAGLFWLTKLRNIEMFIYGIICALSTLINPYGIKLILFNFEHNSYKIMKEYSADWDAIDAKTILGLFCVALVFILLYNMIVSKKKDLFLILLSFSMLFLSLQSARHCIYLLPCILMYVCDYNSSWVTFDSETFFKYASLFIISLTLFTLSSTYTDKNYKENYCMYYCDEELISIMKDSIEKYGSDGLYNDQFPYIDGMKLFITGGYPLISDRYNDSTVMRLGGSDIILDTLIKYYGLNKFVVIKYNADITYYHGLTSLVYDYLASHDEYECLYDSDWYCYFVRKEICSEVK